MVEKSLDKDDDLEKCPECGGVVIFDGSRGEYICSSCGLVVSEHEIDTGQDWRAYTEEEEEKRARTGAPMTYRFADKGLSTAISPPDRDVSSRMRAKIFRWRKWNFRIAARKNLVDALNEVRRIASYLNLSKGILESASKIYRMVFDRHLTRGYSITGMAAASIYVACRLHKTPRPLDEIVNSAKANRKNVTKCIRLILRKLPLKVPKVTALDFVSRYAHDLGVSIKVQRTAVKILEQVYKLGIQTGRDPSGLAASALYIACILEGERRTQKQIAQVAHVTEVTVRNRYKEIVEKLNLKITVR